MRESEEGRGCEGRVRWRLKESDEGMGSEGSGCEGGEWKGMCGKWWSVVGGREGLWCEGHGGVGLEEGKGVCEGEVGGREGV